MKAFSVSEVTLLALMIAIIVIVIVALENRSLRERNRRQEYTIKKYPPHVN